MEESLPVCADAESGTAGSILLGCLRWTHGIRADRNRGILHGLRTMLLRVPCCFPLFCSMSTSTSELLHLLRSTSHTQDMERLAVSSSTDELFTILSPLNLS